MAEKTRCEICNRDFPNQDALTMHNSAKHPIQENTKTNRFGNKAFVYFVIIFIAAVGIVYFTANSVSSAGNVINNAENSDGGDIQKITLGFNGNYYPNTINVKQGVPVEITLDSSVGGCYRSFNIKALSVSKYSSSPSDTIKFTPNQKGTFKFQCSMGMGTGTIIVE